MKSATQNSRIYLHYLDAVAGLAILRVIMLHSLANYTVVGCGASLALVHHELDYRLLDSLMRFSISVFVFISGIKFGLKSISSGDIGYLSYLKNRTRRVIRPYFIFTLLYIIMGQIFFILNEKYGTGLTAFPIESGAHFFQMLLTPLNPAYQLWFLLMLFIVSISYPIWRKFIPWNIIRLITGAALFFVIPWNDLFYPLNYLRFLLIYDMGSIISERLAERNPRGLRIPAISAVFLTVIAMAIRSLSLNAAMIHYAELIIQISLPLALVLPFPAWGFMRGPGILRFLGKNAWPVYLLHDPYILSHVGVFFYVTLNMIHPAVVPFIAGLTLLLSLLASQIVRNTPVLRKIL